MLDEDESVESSSEESESEHNEKNNDEAAPAKKTQNSPNARSKFPDAQHGPSWAEDSELHRVLFDGEGNLKYVGESAPLSFYSNAEAFSPKLLVSQSLLKNVNLWRYLMMQKKFVRLFKWRYQTVATYGEF